MGGYRSDRAWSDTYIPTIRRIVGPLLLEPAPDDDDRERATDLMVLRVGDMRVAARVRKRGYAAVYPTQFTIRSRRESGATTELKKILDGWGDWLFYGHATLRPAEIRPWFLLDLKAFRHHVTTSVGPLDDGEIPNNDGTWFRAYEIRRFPSRAPGDYPLLL